MNFCAGEKFTYAYCKTTRRYKTKNSDALYKIKELKRITTKYFNAQYNIH